ncbi:ADP-ribosylglycohydrolase family protein [Nocardioides ultimimeridianus]
MELTAEQVDRAIGVVLGSACGDALGAGYEFGVATPGPEGPRMIGGGLGGFAPGEWTDDTSMAVVIAEVAATGADLREPAALDAIARGFRRWYDGGPADIGIQTSQVLEAGGPAPSGVGLAAAARAVHERNGRSGGNGSLMRTGPVALAHLDDPEALVSAATAVSALTHHDPQAGEACALWCLAIRHAVLTGETDVRAGLHALPAAARDFWELRLREAESQEPATFRPNGYVVTALQAAWSAIHHTPGSGLVDSLSTAILIGDDTDTVAAIAGSLLGARWGAGAVPEDWRDMLHGWPGLRAEDIAGLAVATVR